MTAKLDYLTDLGINALELQPIQEFNELEYYQVRLSGHALLALLPAPVHSTWLLATPGCGRAHDMGCSASNGPCSTFPLHGGVHAGARPASCAHGVIGRRPCEV